MNLCTTCLGKNKCRKTGKTSETNIPLEDRPVPYTFRVPKTISNYRQASSRHAKCPPFHLQLDHSLAVLWCLFSPDARDKKRLGISQLKWALYFIRGVRDSTGKHPPDVAIAIRTLEDTFIEYCSDMTNLIMRMPIRKKSCLDCNEKPTTQKSKCGICTNASLAYLPRKSMPVKLNTTRTDDSKVSRAHSPSKTMSFDYSTSALDSEIDSILNTTPKFSSTRKDFFQTRETPSTSQKKQTRISESPEVVQNNIGKLKSLIVQLPAQDLDIRTESEETMNDLLQGWHQHQVNKIKEKMVQLHSIETLMGRDRSEFTKSM